MLVYHGTSTAYANAIAAGGIQVALGGGEFGMGFYTGEHLHVARTWAFHTNSRNDAKVVELDIDENDFVSMNPLILDGREAVAYRNNIRSSGTTRTYLFYHNVVWGRIVGTEKIHSDQFKWESRSAEIFLNGVKVARQIVK